jgi:hypothetical protein
MSPEVHTLVGTRCEKRRVCIKGACCPLDRLGEGQTTVALPVLGSTKDSESKYTVFGSTKDRYGWMDVVL